MCEFTGLDFEMAIFEHYFEVGGDGVERAAGAWARRLGMAGGGTC
jgi:hypothetical protein